MESGCLYIPSFSVISLFCDVSGDGSCLKTIGKKTPKKTKNIKFPNSLPDNYISLDCFNTFFNC